MQVLVVSPVPLFPSNGGSRRRIKTLLDAIEARGHVVHFVLLDSRRVGDLDVDAHLAAYGDRFHLLERSLCGAAIYLAKRAARMILRIMKRKRGLDCQFGSADEIYYEPFTEQIRSVAVAVKPDVFLVQYALFSKAFDAAPAKSFRVIDTLDSLSLALNAAEERRALLRADHVIAIQSEEAVAFNNLLAGSGPAVSTIGHLLETHPPIDVSIGDRATFIGSDFTANRISLQYFLLEVMPLIRRELPKFELNVVGSIARTVDDQPGVNKIGYIDDLAEAFATGPILINAIRAGTGLKIKLMEALSYGVPIVSTRLGVMGIDAHHLGGVRVVADDDAQTFASEVVRLAADRAQREMSSSSVYRSAMAWNTRQHDSIDRLLTEAAVHRSALDELRNESLQTHRFGAPRLIRRIMRGPRKCLGHLRHQAALGQSRGAHVTGPGSVISRSNDIVTQEYS